MEGVRARGRGCRHFFGLPSKCKDRVLEFFCLGANFDF